MSLVVARTAAAIPSSQHLNHSAVPRITMMLMLCCARGSEPLAQQFFAHPFDEGRNSMDATTTATHEEKIFDLSVRLQIQEQLLKELVSIVDKALPRANIGETFGSVAFNVSDDIRRRSDPNFKPGLANIKVIGKMPV